MTFTPKRFHDGGQFRIAVIVKEARKKMDVLVVGGDGMLHLKKMPIDEPMLDVDFGAKQERKMKTSLRRLARKKGTPKKIREAVQEVVS